MRAKAHFPRRRGKSKSPDMTFTLYPAIDLKDGQCVRLLRGEMDAATVFNDSPADQAAAFDSAGFTHLHVVDLNGAFAGTSANGDAVKAILKATNAPVQLGGGIRTRSQIDAWIEAGVSRVILGTAALLIAFVSITERTHLRTT